jgi:hypothetical protein
MRGATVKLIRSIPWWQIADNRVNTKRQKRRAVMRWLRTAKARGHYRNQARYEGWFKDGKPRRQDCRCCGIRGRSSICSYCCTHAPRPRYVPGPAPF